MYQHRDNIALLDVRSQLSSNLLLNRLHGYLRTRIPLQRIELLTGRHWVWDSLVCNLKKICAMIILSGHIIDQKGFHCTKDDDCILKQRQNTIGVEHLDTKNDMDGNYLVFDTKIKGCIIGRMVKVSMERR